MSLYHPWWSTHQICHRKHDKFVCNLSFGNSFHGCSRKKKCPWWMFLWPSFSFTELHASCPYDRNGLLCSVRHHWEAVKLLTLNSCFLLRHSEQSSQRRISELSGKAQVYNDWIGANSWYTKKETCVRSDWDLLKFSKAGVICCGVERDIQFCSFLAPSLHGRACEKPAPKPCQSCQGLQA